MADKRSKLKKWKLEDGIIVLKNGGQRCIVLLRMKSVMCKQSANETNEHNLIRLFETQTFKFQAKETSENRK
jgi:hypothetical protein